MLAEQYIIRENVLKYAMEVKRKYTDIFYINPIKIV